MSAADDDCEVDRSSDLYGNGTEFDDSAHTPAATISLDFPSNGAEATRDVERCAMMTNLSGEEVRDDDHATTPCLPVIDNVDAAPTSLHEAITLVTSNEHRSSKVIDLVAIPSVMLDGNHWKGNGDEDDDTNKSSSAASSSSSPPATAVTGRAVELDSNEEADSSENTTTTAVPDDGTLVDFDIGVTAVACDTALNVFADARVVMDTGREIIPLPIQHIQSTLPVDESDTRTDSRDFSHPSAIEPISTSMPITPDSGKATMAGRSTVRIVFSLVMLLLVVGAVISASLCANGRCDPSKETKTSDNSSPPTLSSSTTANYSAEVTTAVSSNQSSTGSIIPNTVFTDETFIAVVNYINNVTLTGRVLAPLNRTSSTTATAVSPEELALTWLLYEDPLQLGYGTPSARFRLVQRYALRTLWVQWDIVDPFFVGDECQWYGLTCESRDLGEDVGVQSVVTEIDFAKNNVTGILPADLGLLSHLVRIDLGENSFHGSLPQSIGTWSMLQEFSIIFNAFTGTIPPSIGQWTSLINLFVGSNSFTGELPESIGQWSRVQKVQLDSNSFNGTIPTAIANWTNATFVSFAGNSFSGSLSQSISQLSTLAYFYTNSNFLTGAIPSSILNWSRLEWASFSFNDFTGSLPYDICKADVRIDADCVSELLCTCCTCS